MVKIWNEGLYPKQNQFTKLDTVSVTVNSEICKTQNMPLGRESQAWKSKLPLKLSETMLSFKKLPNALVLLPLI